MDAADGIRYPSYIASTQANLGALEDASGVGRHPADVALDGGQLPRCFCWGGDGNFWRDSVKCGGSVSHIYSHASSRHPRICTHTHTPAHTLSVLSSVNTHLGPAVSRPCSARRGRSGPAARRSAPARPLRSRLLRLLLLRSCVCVRSRVCVHLCTPDSASKSEGRT